ncbi:MAG: NAD(P)/FAD-dependent oxidoreductase, partial [Bacillota bacterium]
MQSIWNNIKEKNEMLALDKDITRHIVVVGGGISGALCAFRLATGGRKVTLVEADTLYGGVTHNTTAHLDALQGYIYNDLVKISHQKARLYFKSQLDAIEEYQNFIDTYKIDCDFVRADSYMFTVNNLQKLREEFEAMKEIGAEVEFINQKLLNIENQGAIKLKDQAHFHPIKFLEGLPKNYEIIENTRVIKVDTKNKILYTPKAQIKADIIVIATGFPIIDVPGLYFAKMYKSSSYSIAFRGGKLDGVYQADIENGLTYRSYGEYIIMGGLDHRTGRMDKQMKFERLKEKAAKSFGDNLEYTHNWSANDCMTADGIPYAGR